LFKKFDQKLKNKSTTPKKGFLNLWASPVAMGGALLGLAPPNRAPSPSNRNKEHYQSVDFCQFLECLALYTNVKTPY